jgi:hypothetical protein
MGGVGNSDGTGAAARFNSPYGVATDSAGNVYVADANNSTIRKITPAGVVTTLAGTAGSAGSTDATGAVARFSSPYGVAADSAGKCLCGRHQQQHHPQGHACGRGHHARRVGGLCW